jgi:hypothetical protein
MPQLRVIEIRDRITGDVTFKVQKKRWLLGWLGADDFEDYSSDCFSTLDEAIKNLCRWDGTGRATEKVVWP